MLVTKDLFFVLVWPAVGFSSNESLLRLVKFGVALSLSPDDLEVSTQVLMAYLHPRLVTVPNLHCALCKHMPVDPTPEAKGLFIE